MIKRFWNRHPRLEAALGTALGLAIVLGGAGGYADDHALAARGVSTTALVVGAHPGRDPSYDVRFALPDHRVVTAETSYADNTATVGDTIRIQYDSQDPQTVAEAGARSGAWIVWGGWLLTGVAMTLYSIRLWRRRPIDEAD